MVGFQLLNFLFLIVTDYGPCILLSWLLISRYNDNVNFKYRQSYKDIQNYSDPSWFIKKRDRMTERCIIYIERLRWLFTLINRIADFSIWSKAIAWKYCTLQPHWVMFRLINIPYLNTIAYPNTEENRTTDETELSNNWDKQAIDKLLGTWKKVGNFKLVPRNKRRNGTGQPSNF